MLTFEKYGVNNWRYLVKIVGRPSLLNPKDLTMITDSLQRYDPDNAKYIRRVAINMVQELHIGMSRNKASRQLTQNVINNSFGLIKR